MPPNQTCRRCHTAGHNRQTCPIPKPPPTKHCSKCGNIGHNARTCAVAAPPTEPTVTVAPVEVIDPVLAEYTRVYKNIQIYKQANDEIRALGQSLETLQESLRRRWLDTTESGDIREIRWKAHYALRLLSEHIHEVGMDRKRWEVAST